VLRTIISYEIAGVAGEFWKRLGPHWSSSQGSWGQPSENNQREALVCEQCYVLIPLYIQYMACPCRMFSGRLILGKFWLLSAILMATNADLWRSHIYCSNTHWAALDISATPCLTIDHLSVPSASTLVPFDCEVDGNASAQSLSMFDPLIPIDR